MKASFQSMPKNFWPNKFLPVFSFLFFIFARIFFNFILWRGRILPPEPGDVFNYLRWIEAVKTSFLDLTPFYAAYSFILGNIAKIFSLSPETVFYCTFYFGFILLAFVLWHFFKKLKFNPIQISICFVLLSFYIGRGAFHGFFWVVPSFFAFLIFLYLFTQINSGEKINYWFLAIVSIIFPLMHGTAIFSLLAFLIYAFIYFFISSFPQFSFKKFFAQFLSPLFQKILIIIILGSISFFSFSAIINKISKNKANQADSLGYSEIFENIEKSISLENGISLNANKSVAKVREFFQKDKIATKILGEDVVSKILPVVEIIVKRFGSFNFNYLSIIIPHFAFILFWIIIFLTLFCRKRTKIICFYLAIFVFSFFSTLMHYKGHRSLLYLWPITYILLGVFFYDFYFVIEKLSKKFISKEKTGKIISGILKTLFVFLVIIFCLFHVVYGLWYMNLKNRDFNYPDGLRGLDLIIENYSPQDTAIYLDNPMINSRFNYLSCGKNYYYRLLYRESYLKSLKSDKYKKIVVVLTDDYVYYQKVPGDFWKNILEKLALVFPSIKDNSQLDEKTYKTIEEKIPHFYLPAGKKYFRDIYRSDFYYIFELVDYP